MPQYIIILFDILGTVSFAISGALVAIKARLDIFGIIFIGAITATGGGIIRDSLIGRIPPAIFSKFYIFLIAALTAVTVFVVAEIYRRKFYKLSEKVEQVNNIFDAIGLGAFSVMGTEVAFAEDLSDNIFLSVVLGMLTGVGGGIIRDILTDQTPYVFKKHIYAIASIIGSSLYYILRANFNGTVIASIAALLCVVIIRMLATKFRWSLPKIKLDEENVNTPTH